MAGRLAAVAASTLVWCALASKNAVRVLPESVAFKVVGDALEVAWTDADGSPASHRLERMSNLYAHDSRVVTPSRAGALQHKGAAAAHTFASPGGAVLCTVLPASSAVLLLVRDETAGTVLEIGPLARYDRELAERAPHGAYAVVSHAERELSKAHALRPCGAVKPPPFVEAAGTRSDEGVIKLVRSPRRVLDGGSDEDGGSSDDDSGG